MLELDIENRIVAALRQIMRAVDLHSRHLVDVCGLTGPQLAALQAARRLGPSSSSAIAREIHLSLPTVTGILNRLESRGLICRVPRDDDRRSRTIELTSEGERMLHQAPSLLQDRLRRELSSLDEWEQHMMLATLQRIASMMDADRLDAAPHLVAEGPSLANDPQTGDGSDLPSPTNPEGAVSD